MFFPEIATHFQDGTHDFIDNCDFGDKDCLVIFNFVSSYLQESHEH